MCTFLRNGVCHSTVQHWCRRNRVHACAFYSPPQLFHLHSSYKTQGRECKLKGALTQNFEGEITCKTGSSVHMHHIMRNISTHAAWGILKINSKACKAQLSYQWRTLCNRNPKVCALNNQKPSTSSLCCPLLLPLPCCSLSTCFLGAPSIQLY